MLRAAAGHPDHDARVALPAADLAARARSLRGVETRDRGRGARRRRHEARSPPRACRSSAWSALVGEPVQRDRPVRRPSGRWRRSAASSPAAARSSSSTPGAPRSSTSKVVVPLDDMRGAGGGSTIDLAVDLPRDPRSSSREHRSTIVFVNNRRLAERLRRLNELRTSARRATRSRAPTTARWRASSGVEVEELLKKGEIPCLVATSSLELGIDMGAVDLVIQVESPKSVARGLQRVGRAGHELGARLEGPHLPKFRADLLESAVRRPADARGRDRGDRDPAQPARRARAADRRDLRRRGDRGRRAAPARAPRLSVRRALARPARERARHARRAVTRRTSSQSSGRGSSGTARRGVVRGRAGRATARGHERGHDPRPRPLRRPPRATAAVASASSTRRWSTRRAPARRSCSAPRRWRIEEITARPRARLAGPGRARRRCRSGRARASAGRTSSARRSARARGSWSALDQTRRRQARLRDEHSRRARRAEPAHLPARAGAARRVRSRPTARSWSSASATRSATGGSASSRRSAAGCTRRGRSRSRARIARVARASRRNAIWSDDGIAIHLPDADAPPPSDDRADRPRARSRSWSSAKLGDDGALRRALPRERRAARC